MDIERSKQTAREIVQEAEAGKSLHAHMKDASNKVHLLRKELEFNQTLADTLEELQVVSGLLDSAQDAASEDELLESLGKLDNARKGLDRLDTFEKTRFTGLLRRRASQLRDLLAGMFLNAWNKNIAVDSQERRIWIFSHAKGVQVSHVCMADSNQRPDSPLSIYETANALSELGLLESAIARFHRELDTLIISPRFAVTRGGSMSNLVVDTEAIWTSGTNQNPSATAIVQDVRNLVSYLTQRLPKLVFDPLLERILPSLMVQLINGWLDSSLPLKMVEMESFQQSLSSILELAEYIESFGINMPSEADLSDWIQRLPVTWMSRRREAALADMRAAAYRDVRSKKSAERVETQMVAHDDVMVSGNQQEDDWNADWADEPDEQHEDAAKAQPSAGPVEDVEDARAWGLEDDPAEASNEKQEESAATAEGEEDADAWGWGDDVEESADPTKPEEATTQEINANGSAERNRPADREITLRETFTITALPDSILTLISQVLSDAQTLASPTFPIQQIAAAAPALSSIPTLLLALYRATAASFYEADPASNMFLYNDTQYLVSSLKDLISNIPSTHPLAKRLRLDNDIRLLESFAKRAYGREMDSQRTILRDLLSSASSFVNCSAPINAREYSNTVLITVDRIREVDQTWRNVLSASARLQSLGSLLSTVISKMTSDILELADNPSGISEEQSIVLKGFCDQVAQVADLFEQVDPNTGEKRTLVQVYTPDWFRFMYLGEILEASLADIKYLWTEGELGLEFEMGEVIDLIEALFADSEYRRNAIKDIRNHGGER